MTRDQRKRRLSRDDAIALAQQRLVEFTGDYGQQLYAKKPSSVGKVSVGWVVEFKPIRPQAEDGKSRLALTSVSYTHLTLPTKA